MAHEASATRPHGVELKMYDTCNARCISCHASQASGRAIEAVANLALRDQYGLRFLWLGDVLVYWRTMHFQSDIVAASAAARGGPTDARVVRSLYKPRGTLPPCQRDRASPAAAEGLMDANRGARRARLKSSPIEAGMFRPTCSACAARLMCSGVRADCARIQWTDEFHPIEGSA